MFADGAAAKMIPLQSTGFFKKLSASVLNLVGHASKQDLSKLAEIKDW